MKIINTYLNDKERIIVADLENGKYAAYFNYDVKHDFGQEIYFDALIEAENIIKKLRPTAEKLNAICRDCTNRKCYGTTEKLWSGCVFKTKE